MRYVYYVHEKLDEDFSLEELVVYETFDKAVQIAKELIKKEFEYITSSSDEKNLETDLFLKKEKEFFKGKISNEDETFYVITVKKIPIII